MYRYVLLLLGILLAGCASDSDNFRSPNLLQPGHISKQEGWAHRFDPFASPEMGPKIVGDRPSGSLDPTPASQRHCTCPGTCHVHR